MLGHGRSLEIITSSKHSIMITPITNCCMNGVPISRIHELWSMEQQSQPELRRTFHSTIWFIGKIKRATTR